MQVWEALAHAVSGGGGCDAGSDGKIQAYRRTIRIDYACELAHQKLAAVAARLAG
jgi:hypothetical protein